MDRYAAAPIALLIAPLSGLLMVALFIWIGASRFKGEFEAGRHIIHAAITMLLLLHAGLETVYLVIGTGGDVDLPRLVSFAVAIMFLVIGNVLPKSRKNWIAGIRIPWTLNDEENWRVTHYWTGRLMMIGGIVLGLAAVVMLPASTLFSILIAALLVPAVIGIAISYKMAKAAQKPRD